MFRLEQHGRRRGHSREHIWKFAKTGKTLAAPLRIFRRGWGRRPRNVFRTAYPDAIKIWVIKSDSRNLNPCPHLSATLSRRHLIKRSCNIKTFIILGLRSPFNSAAGHYHSPCLDLQFMISGHWISFCDAWKTTRKRSSTAPEKADPGSNFPWHTGIRTCFHESGFLKL